MSYEMALISRVVEKGEINEVLEFGITEDDFTTAEAKGCWKLVFAYYTNPVTNGSVMHAVNLRHYFKEFLLEQGWDAQTTRALCYEVRKNRVIAETRCLAARMSEQVEVDPTGTLSEAHSRIQALCALGVNGNTDIPMHQGLDRIQTRMSLVERGHDFSRFKWPWTPLEDVTGGLQEDDYIVFYGRPKSGKTWCLCYLLACAFHQEKRVLVYTKEMTPDNIFMRVAACINQIVYNEMRHSRLTAEQKKALLFLRELDADPTYRGHVTCLSGRDAPPGGDNVPWLHGKIDKYKPDIVFIDGLYLLSEEAGKKSQADNVRVMNISRGLRAMNLATKVPIIATTQANRKAAAHNQANLDEIAFSDGLSQDATILTRVIADKDGPTFSLVIGGSREFTLHGFRINAVPARDFSYHSMLTEKDIEKAKQQDADAEEVKKAKKKSSGVATKDDKASQQIEAQMATIAS